MDQALGTHLSNVRLLTPILTHPQRRVVIGFDTIYQAPTITVHDIVLSASPRAPQGFIPP